MTEKRDRKPKPGEPVADLLPSRPTLAAVRRIAKLCRACDLYKRGDQRRETLQVGTAWVHPSSILRAPDDESRRDEMRRFVEDLKKVSSALSPTTGGNRR